MKRNIGRSLVCVLALVMASAAWADSVEIRLKNGTRWRGEIADPVMVEFRDAGVTIGLEGRLRKVTDLYIQVEGELAGLIRTKTIFRNDLVSMKTVEPKAEDAADKVTKGLRGRKAARSGGKDEGGEAEALRLLADAYRQDPEFYRFLRSLESYEKIIDENTTLFIESDSALMEALNGG